MTIRITNPKDWDELLPGQTILIGGEGERNVKIEFNTSADTVFHLLWETADEATGDVKLHKVFLGYLRGNDKVEFSAGPQHWLEATSDGEVWYFTNDGQYVAVNPLVGPDGEGVNFTKLLGEQTRADAIEEMLRIQTARYEQLRQQQAVERQYYAEIEQRIAADEAAAREAAGEQTIVVDPLAPEGEGDAGGGDGPSVSA